MHNGGVPPSLPSLALKTDKTSLAVVVEEEKDINPMATCQKKLPLTLSDHSSPKVSGQPLLRGMNY